MTTAPSYMPHQASSGFQVPSSTGAVSRVFGVKRDMSAALPKHQTLRCSQTFSAD